MNNLYQPTQNHSLLYSTTTMGASLFKSPNIGESHHQFRGRKNNWVPENQNQDVSSKPLIPPSVNHLE
jgi:hypothetical protein